MYLGFDMEFSVTGPAAFLLQLPFSVKLIAFEFNGFPVAYSSNGYFFFVMDMGSGLVWVVGSVIGDMSSVWMKQSSTSSPTINIPSFGWMYFSGGIWIEALTLVGLPTKGI